MLSTISRILGIVILGLAGCYMIPLAIAAYYQFWADPASHPQPHSTVVFFESILICIGAAALLFYFGRKGVPEIYRREALATVVALWIILPALCALPLYLGNVLQNPWMAYFEAVSGLTTTGATTMQAKQFDPKTGAEVPIVKKVPGVIETTYIYSGTLAPLRDPQTGNIIAEGFEGVSRAILFWRSFMQWLGGGGIIVLFVAILPALGAGGKVLFQTDVPGPRKETQTPRIKETAYQLWMIYLVLTILIILLFVLTNSSLEWLDVITLTFGSLSTGGFSIHDASVNYYDSAATDWAVIIAMLIGSISFSIYYSIWTGRFYKVFTSELLLYGAILVVSCGLAALYLSAGPDTPLVGEKTPFYSLGNAIRDGTFQVVSSITTTGFTTTNYDKWPYVVQAILLLVMYVGGMSGSTSGGIKIIRHLILFKIAQHKIETLFRPKMVRRLLIEGREVDEGAMFMVLTFLLLLLACATLGTFIYIMDGLDLESAFATVACMINCTGLSFRAGGPGGSFAFLSDFSLFLSSVLMILGRLEFFAVLALLVPAFWRQE